MDESQKHNVEQNESDTEDNILYNLIFIKFINSENVSFLMGVRLDLRKILTTRGHEEAYWDGKLFNIISVITWM